MDVKCLTDFNHLASFDRETIYENFDGDEEIMALIIDKFQEGFDTYLNNIEQAIEASDFKNLELHAHTLKGVAANLYLLKLKELCFYLENNGRNQVMENSKEAYTWVKEEANLALKTLLNLKNSFSEVA